MTFVLRFDADVEGLDEAYTMCACVCVVFHLFAAAFTLISSVDPIDGWRGAGTPGRV